MNDKYAKEIAKELRLIRVELQKMTNPQAENETPIPMTYDELKEATAGERVTIK